MRMCSRRRVLQAVATVGIAGGASGCLGPTVVPGTDADYATWLPAPSSLPHQNRYAVGSVVQSALDRGADLLAADLQQSLQQFVTSGPRRLGIDTDSVAVVHRLGLFATVMVGDFSDYDADLGPQWNEVGGEGDFERYVSADHGAAMAVRANAVVLTPYHPDESGSFIEPVLEANVGPVDRYGDSNERVKVLTEAIGDGDMVLLREGPAVDGLDDVVATGVSWRLTDDVAKTSVGLAFPDSDAVDTAAIEQQVSEDPRFDPFDGLSVGQHGNVGVVTATAPTVTAASVAPLRSLSREDWRRPRASFTFDTDGRRVTIIHDGGDPVPQSRLSVDGQGFSDHPDADLTGPGQWSGETSHGGTTVAPGDTVTVGADVAPEFELRYRPLGEASPVVLASGP